MSCKIHLWAIYCGKAIAVAEAVAAAKTVAAAVIKAPQIDIGHGFQTITIPPIKPFSFFYNNVNSQEKKGNL